MMVMNCIGLFVMSQKDNVYVASTFWLNCSSKGRFLDLKNYDLKKFDKFIFPVHCPGHWWCVMIDMSEKLYGEYDPLCQNRNGGYVFELLHKVFQMANIDLSSFRKLNWQERQHIPSQGDNITECGVFLLGFMCAFVNCLELSFNLNFLSFLWHSFAKIIPESVSGSVKLGQDNNHSSENLEVVQSKSGMADCT